MKLGRRRNPPGVGFFYSLNPNNLTLPCTDVRHTAVLGLNTDKMYEDMEKVAVYIGVTNTTGGKVEPVTQCPDKIALEIIIGGDKNYF